MIHHTMRLTVTLGMESAQSLFDKWKADPSQVVSFGPAVLWPERVGVRGRLVNGALTLDFRRGVGVIEGTLIDPETFPERSLQADPQASTWPGGIVWRVGPRGDDADT